MGNKDNHSGLREAPLDDYAAVREDAGATVNGGRTGGTSTTTTITDDGDFDLPTSAATSLHQLSAIVSEFRSTLRDQAKELEENRVRLRDCDARLAEYEIRQGEQQPSFLEEAEAYFRESITKSTEFSIDCISEATATGLQKIEAKLAEATANSEAPHYYNQLSSPILGLDPTNSDNLPISSTIKSLDIQELGMILLDDSITPVAKTESGRSFAVKTDSSKSFAEDTIKPLPSETFSLGDIPKTLRIQEPGLGNNSSHSLGKKSNHTKISYGTVERFRYPKSKRQSVQRVSQLSMSDDIGEDYINNDNSFYNSSSEFMSIKSNFRNLSNIKQFEAKMASGGAPRYPPDSYSFMHIHGPLEQPKYFFFGLSVFFFQIAFFWFIIIASFKEITDVHNPSPLLKFIPSNVTVLVRMTQITALFSYLFFADASIRDCALAFELFPRFDVNSQHVKRGRAVFACFLRLFQGFMASLAALLLILTSQKVIDIILNFTALNFISCFDEVAFELAKWGKYGPGMEREARVIERKPIPYCLFRKYKHKRHIGMVITIGSIMLTLITYVIIQQDTSANWDTQILRVQLFDGLEPYSGCYEVDSNPSIGLRQRRKAYRSLAFADNSVAAVIGYCEKDFRWILSKAADDNDGYSQDPCLRENWLAYTGKMDDFDVSATFYESWFTAGGTPLDARFFDTNGNSLELREHCGSFLNDGRCDLIFNELGYGYDGGDCCAPTCKKAGVCGRGGVHDVFGSGGIAGYSDCIDPNLASMTIVLNNITSSRDPQLLNVTESQEVDYYRERGIDFWEERPTPAYFVIDCDGTNVLSTYIDDTMKYQSEKIMVNDGARCRVDVRNNTNFNEHWDDAPIWWVDFTIYHGNNTSIEALSVYSGDVNTGSFRRIPDCYFDALGNLTDASTAYTSNTDTSMALRWLVDTSGAVYSVCDSTYLIERFALGALNFAAPFVTADSKSSTRIFPLRDAWRHPDEDETALATSEDNINPLWVSEEQQCSWDSIACLEGSVNIFSLRNRNLSGTISTAIGLLTGLTRINYDKNRLSGTIPTELGMLTNLTGLDIDENQLTGPIPTEMGRLTHMQELDLDRNRLSGTIPTEFGDMRGTRELDLRGNQLSGPVPTEIGRLTNMVTLYLENNRLSGSIPGSIMTIQRLSNLHLANNNITGTIPIEIGQLEELRTVYFDRNEVRGTIPTEIGKLTNLRKLDLQTNRLSGSIPTEIGRMTSLDTLHLCGNSLVGSIPSEIGLLTKLTKIGLENNDLSGTLPLQIRALDLLNHTDSIIGCN